eukprot:7415077-Pyramimonas_sp.AAC.1
MKLNIDQNSILVMRVDLLAHCLKTLGGAELQRQGGACYYVETVITFVRAPDDRQHHRSHRLDERGRSECDWWPRLCFERDPEGDRHELPCFLAASLPEVSG